jgi:hypothetical protein
MQQRTTATISDRPSHASRRNCQRMSFRLAPTASRIPISRVLSVTDTNIMFRMPIPPVASETRATDASKTDNVLAPASLADVTADRFFT